MGKGIENRDEAIDGVKGEGGYGGDITSAEEGRLEQKEKDQGGAEIGSREGAGGSCVDHVLFIGSRWR